MTAADTPSPGSCMTVGSCSGAGCSGSCSKDGAAADVVMGVDGGCDEVVTVIDDDCGGFGVGVGGTVIAGAEVRTKLR